MAAGACSGDDDPPPRRATPKPPVAAPGPAVGTDADRRAALRFERSHSDRELGYSLRYPTGWRPETSEPLLLKGPGGGSCVVAAAGALPDWTSSELRVAYVLRGAQSLGSSAGLAPATAGVVRGANAEGAGAVATLRSNGGRRRARTAVLASAGTGVALSCVSSERLFRKVDREVFRPIIASTRVRREPELEPVQAQVAAMDGVEAASLAIRSGAVEVTLELRRTERARFVSRAVMQELMRSLPGRDLTLKASRGGRPLADGSYDYERRRGVVGFAGR